MTEGHWDFYFCQIDDRPASIFFSEDVAKKAPIASYGKMVALRVHLKRPRDDGMPSDEFETLKAIEDKLEAAIEATKQGVYVGRVTNGGHREFFFYASHAEQVLDALSAAMSGYPDYEFDTHDRDDADWAVFREFLYPSAHDRQRIENRKVCEGLKSHGDALTEKREIHHWAYFPDPATRDKFVTSVANLGFDLEDKSEPGEHQKDFGANVFRIDYASWNEINEVTIQLFELADELGGEYAGWESLVVKS